MDSPRPHTASNGAYFYVNGGLYSKGDAGFCPFPARFPRADNRQVRSAIAWRSWTDFFVDGYPWALLLRPFTAWAV